MKKIMLGEEASKDITTLLECIIYSNAANPDVTGMYLKEYDFENSGRPTIELVMLYNGVNFPIESINEFYGLNIEGIQKKHGIEIRISAVPEKLVSYFPDLDFRSMEFLDILIHYDKCREFMNSKIVYDPEEKYDGLQERLIEAHNKNTLKLNNLIEFVPPIELKRLK